MAQSDKTTINANFNQAGSGYFPDNTTREISEADVRLYVSTMNDSVPNMIDNAFDGLKGLKPGISTIAGLRAISTVSQSTGVFCTFRDTANSNILRTYELVTGTGTSPNDDESSPRQIKPTDYASGLPKIWKLASISGVTPWELSDNIYLDEGVIGQMYYGTRTGLPTTLVDPAGNPLQDKVLAISLVDNPSGVNDYMYIGLIF